MEFDILMSLYIVLNVLNLLQTVFTNDELNDIYDLLSCMILYHDIKKC